MSGKAARILDYIRLWRQATTVEFEGSRFQTSKVDGTSGVAVLVAHDERLGFLNPPTPSTDQSASGARELPLG